MLKYITTLFIASAAYFSSSQVTIFEEDFQSAGSLAQWKVVNQDQLTPGPDVSNYTDAWILVTDPENQADTVASATSSFTSPGRADRWLISPPITLGTFGNFLSWSAKSFDPSYPENYSVLISTTDDNIESFTDTLGLFIFENYVWTDYDFSLSGLGFDNQQIYIAFVLTTYDANRIFLDDVKVRKDDNLGVQEHASAKRLIYPNPATDVVHIAGVQFDQASIFAASGQKMGEIISGEQTVNVSSYDQGVYYIRFSDRSGTRTEKFVKR